MKRLLSSLCALGICLGLAACAPQNNETAPSAATTVTSASTSEAKQTSLHVTGFSAQPSPDWVKSLPEAQDPSVSQLFIVAASAMDKTTTYITMDKRDKDGNWNVIV